MYSSESADTVTALNNIGCCLYCLHKRGDARARFERTWTLLSKTLGPRHPRTIVVWRNLDRARKSQASLLHQNMNEIINIREDSDKLLFGGNFIINATLRPKSSTMKKKVKGKGKKSK